MRSDIQKYGHVMHKFKYPVYSVKRKQNIFQADIENANTVVSPGDNVRSILAQVGSMKLEDGEEGSSEVGLPVITL